MIKRKIIFYMSSTFTKLPKLHFLLVLGGYDAKYLEECLVDRNS